MSLSAQRKYGAPTALRANRVFLALIAQICKVKFDLSQFYIYEEARFFKGGRDFLTKKTCGAAALAIKGNAAIASAVICRLRHR